MASKTLTATKDARYWDGGATYGNLGAGKTPYNSVGSYSGNWRTSIGFSSLPSGIVSLTSAILHFKSTSEVYTPFTGGSMDIRRCTEGWTENGANNPLSTDPTVYPGPSSSATHAVTKTFSTAKNTWYTANITDIVQDWIDGTGKESWGIIFFGNGSACIEIYGRESSYEPYIEITYETNQKPEAHTETPDGGGQTYGSVTTPVPTYVGNFDDPDSGDEVTHIQIQVDTNPAVGSPFWDSVENIPNANHGTFTIPYTGGTNHVRGTTYYWRVRASDDGGSTWGDWSGIRDYTYNQLPTVSILSPATDGYARIWNLAVGATGTTTLSPAARVTWTFSDASGNPQSAYRLRIYSASVAGTLLYDSGKTASANASLDTSLTLTRNTDYWVTLQVWDSSDESSAETARRRFRVDYAQAIYEFAPTGGAASSGWRWANASMAANTEAAFAFRTATGAAGAGAGAWAQSIGSLTPNTYLNVMVRLQTYLKGTQPALPDMTFTYTAGATFPDKWSLSGTGATMALDSDVRRFGAKSLKVVPGTASALVFPTVDIPVQSSTTYTFSVFLKTNGALTHGDLQLRVRRSGTTDDTILVSGITNTGASPQGWQRVQFQYTTASDETTVRAMIYYNNSGAAAGDSFWIDAAKFEEGSVATAWMPGFIADPVILDSNGIQVDAVAGGIFRLRGSSGAARDTVELGVYGLKLGGDTDIKSPAAGVVTSGRVSGVIATRVATSQSIGTGGSPTNITFPTEERDTDGYHSTSSNTDRLVAPFDGWYDVQATVDWATFAADSRAVHQILTDTGAQVSRQRGHYTTSGAGSTSLGGKVYLTAGQYVIVNAFQNTGSSVNITDARFSMIYLGV